MPHEANLTRLLGDTIGTARADALFGAMQVADSLLEERGETVSRAVLAQTLNMLSKNWAIASGKSTWV
jgi:hypothetical protein